MRRLRLIHHRLRSIFRPAAVQDELERELRLHMEQLTRESLAAGLDADDAERAARRAFGSFDVTRERCRDTRRVGLVDDLWRDLRYGARLLVRAPGFTATAVLSLALGLGVTTGIFGVADAVLWRLLPVTNPRDLVFLKVAGSDGTGGAPPYPVFEQMRTRTTAFAGMAAFASDELRTEVDGQIEQVNGQVVSGSYFDVLGLVPEAGRLMTQADERTGQRVAVVSHAYAERRFGGAAPALGRTLGVGRDRFTVIGVTPRPFKGLVPGRSIDVSLPITVVARELVANDDVWWFEAVARLAPGSGVAQATAQADAILDAFMDTRPAASSTARMRRAYFDRLVLTPASAGLDGLRGRFRTPLFVLAIVSGAVLCITCLNLGNLLLVRGAARERELAVRIATGAAVERLCRQLLTETLLLLVIGATLGIFVAHAVVGFLAGSFAVGRNPILLEVPWDWRVWGFGLAVTLVAGLSTGLWPAIRLLRSGQFAAVRGHGVRLAGSARLSRTARLSVATQVALSLVLLVCAVMSVRTMANLRSVTLGFSPAQVLTMSIDPLDLRDAEDGASARPPFWAEVLRRVRALPGVRSASVSVLTPLSGRDSARLVSVAGYQPPDDRDRLIRINHVSEDYFDTFGMALRDGRGLAARDVSGPRVAVINTAAAAHFFGARTPIGETLDFGAAGVYQVVGVVGDHKHRTLREEPTPMVFVPIWHGLEMPTRVTLSVASRQASALQVRAVADEVRGAHSRTLVSDVIAVDEQIDATLVGERLLSTLATGLALLAIGLAALGLHGVLSDVVARRRAEFGVRMALGARPAHVAGSVYREVIWQLIAGVAIGIPMALAIMPRGASLLFGVTPAEPSTYVASVALLVGVALLAAGAAARRASRIDPSEALRQG